MFLWIKLNLTTGSSDSEEGDSLDLISTKAVEKGFLAVPGMVRPLVFPTTPPV